MATDNFARFMALQALDNSNSGSSDTSNNAGKIVTGKVYTYEGGQYTAQVGAEIFNDYENNVAVEQYSHAEGGGTKAIGIRSHSEGDGTTAVGDCSHAEGGGTTARGNFSHSEGYGTTAMGNYSHAAGYNTVALRPYSYVIGKNNLVDTESPGRFAFIIGNGTDTARSNAFAIDWEGNIYIRNSNVSINLLDLLARIEALEGKNA